MCFLAPALLGPLGHLGVSETKFWTPGKGSSRSRRKNEGCSTEFSKGTHISGGGSQKPSFGPPERGRPGSAVKSVVKKSTVLEGLPKIVFEPPKKGSSEILTKGGRSAEHVRVASVPRSEGLITAIRCSGYAIAAIAAGRQGGPVS